LEKEVPTTKESGKFFKFFAKKPKVERPKKKKLISKKETDFGTVVDQPEICPACK
jgi:hypothetical protein